MVGWRQPVRVWPLEDATSAYKAVGELKQARDRRHPTQESRKGTMTHRRHGIETPVRGPASGRSPGVGCDGAGGGRERESEALWFRSRERSDTNVLSGA